MRKHLDGSLMIRPPLSNESPLTGGWTTLDVSTGYGDYLVAQTEKICGRYDVDGFFFDICFPVPNYSPLGQARMREAGVRPDDERAVLRFAEVKLKGFLERLSKVVRAKVPWATIYYNGTVNPRMAETLHYQTHFEIESLPTSSGIWGYLHYPVMAAGPYLRGRLPRDDRALPQGLGRLRRPEDPRPARLRVRHHRRRRRWDLRRRPAPPARGPRPRRLPFARAFLRQGGETRAFPERGRANRGGGDPVRIRAFLPRKHLQEHARRRRGRSRATLPGSGDPVRHRRSLARLLRGLRDHRAPRRNEHERGPSREAGALYESRRQTYPGWHGRPRLRDGRVRTRWRPCRLRGACPDDTQLSPARRGACGGDRAHHRLRLRVLQQGAPCSSARRRQGAR